MGSMSETSPFSELSALPGAGVTEGAPDGDPLLERARETLRAEAGAVLALLERLDGRFVRAVELLYACRGRVVVTGMGKSGLIGKKLAATLSSTGTPAVFLHPAEGVHGDLGMVTREDAVIMLSNSGETAEVVATIPVVKRLGVPLVSLVGRMGSTLARLSDVALDVSVEREACPLNLAPTSSTAAALAMGDALAMALLEKRHFGPEEFALLHPGGNLGRRLLLRVGEVMHRDGQVPLVDEGVSVREALLEMSAKRLGMTGVRSGSGELVGIITDGDIRRRLERDGELLVRRAGEVMSPRPRWIGVHALAAEALRHMEEHKITSLFVKDGEGHLVGAVHLHDLLAAGLA